MDLTYFTFRSVVSAAAVDSRTRDRVLSLEFSLRLSQALSFPLGVASTTDTKPYLGTNLS